MIKGAKGDSDMVAYRANGLTTSGIAGVFFWLAVMAAMFAGGLILGSKCSEWFREMKWLKEIRNVPTTAAATQTKSLDVKLDDLTMDAIRRRLAYHGRGAANA